MSIINQGIGYIRANPDPSFQGGNVDGITDLPYANLFFPYILDNANNPRQVSLTIDVINKEDLEVNPLVYPEVKSISEDRLRGSLSESQDIWAIRETSHPTKKSQSISNAFCFGGQKLSFYIAPQGHNVGYANDSWTYCKTRLRITAFDASSGTETTICDFEDFESSSDSSSRYFVWEVPSINNSMFSSCGLFGLCVIRGTITNTYYSDPERLSEIEGIPNQNEFIMQVLIFSGAKEIIEVNDVGIFDIVDGIISYDDALNVIFEKTVFRTLESLNQNVLTSDQKRAIIADQIAVLFMSQHPVATADRSPLPILGVGVDESVSLRKIVDKAATYSRRYNTCSLDLDRLYGMMATYRAYNFYYDLEAVISDYNQSTQSIRDPIRVISMDSNGVLDDELGINGITFAPYHVKTYEADFPIDSVLPHVVNLPLYEFLVDLEPIRITDPYGDPLQPYQKLVKVGIEPTFGDDKIKQIRFSVFTDNMRNYETYTDIYGKLRDCVFSLEYNIVRHASAGGDVVTAQVDIEDVEGGVTSFIGEVAVLGWTSKPVLSDMSIYQKSDGSRAVDIFFNYHSDAEIKSSTVGFEFSEDGGLSWKSSNSIKGDYGDGVFPGRRRIVWFPENDLADKSYGSSAMCKITIEDVDGGIQSKITGMLVHDFENPIIAVRQIYDEEETSSQSVSSSSSSSSSSYIENWSSSSSSSTSSSSSSSTEG